MRTTPKISVLWIFLNKSHLNTGGEKCREQIHTHKTKFLKAFLDLVQSGGAINPKMENFRVMPVNSPAFDRQNQIHVSVSKHSFVLIVTPWKPSWWYALYSVHVSFRTFLVKLLHDLPSSMTCA